MFFQVFLEKPFIRLDVLKRFHQTFIVCNVHNSSVYFPVTGSKPSPMFLGRNGRNSSGNPSERHPLKYCTVFPSSAVDQVAHGTAPKRTRKGSSDTWTPTIYKNSVVKWGNPVGPQSFLDRFHQGLFLQVSFFQPFWTQKTWKKTPQLKGKISKHRKFLESVLNRPSNPISSLDYFWG